MIDYNIIAWAALLGVGRGFVSLMLEHPFDVIKTRAQANLSFTSISKITQLLYKEKGWLGFYSGAVPNMLRVAIKQAYRYPLMLILPIAFSPLLNSVLCISLMTAITIAVLEVFIITPLERMKVWIITYKTRSNSFRSFVYTLRTGIIKTLFKGLSATAYRQIATWVTFLVTHDQLMSFAQATYASRSIPFVIFLGISIIEGGINTAVVMPLDCMKTQLQKTDSESASFLDTFRRLYFRHGGKAFYTGWQVKLFQYIIHAAFTVALLEQLRNSVQSINY
jgi:hypothetical protein